MKDDFKRNAALYRGTTSVQGSDWHLTNGPWTAETRQEAAHVPKETTAR